MPTGSDDSTDAGLQIDPVLRDFVAEELLAGLDLEPAWFWSTVADLNERFSGRVDQLLRRRDELQEQIDAWHRENGAGDVAALEAFLTEIGYLLPVDLIASSAGWGIEKPSPRFFERIARELDLPAPAIAYVGDRLDNDVLPAQAAGMLGVFIRRGPWGHIHATWPEASEADHQIESLDEVIRILRP